MFDPSRFADLGQPRRIWAVGAAHGEAARLAALHAEIGLRFVPGDRLVYLGSILGRSRTVIEAVDEALAFRRTILARPGVLAGDIVFLRGAQEEMWHKLLQLQLAPNPSEVLAWMLRQGVEATLRAYGGDPQQGLDAARQGAVALTRWTNGLRSRIRAIPGHDTMMSALRRATFTTERVGPAAGSARLPAGVLLVHAGIDPSKPLTDQRDTFWWGGQTFNRLRGPYGAFARIVRGYDPSHPREIVVGETGLSLDAGAGYGGRLACACLSPSGEVLEIIEA